MRLILNIIWLVFGGLWLALGLSRWPRWSASCSSSPSRSASPRLGSRCSRCGRSAGPSSTSPDRRPGATVGNVIWVLLCGIWLAIGHIISAIAMAVTIVGIPLALANLKLIPVSLMPLGKEIVPVDRARDWAQHRAGAGMTLTDPRPAGGSPRTATAAGRCRGTGHWWTPSVGWPPICGCR